MMKLKCESYIEDVVTETYDNLKLLMKDLEMEKDYIFDTHNTTMSKVILDKIRNEVEEGIMNIHTAEALKDILHRE